MTKRSPIATLKSHDFSYKQRFWIMMRLSRVLVSVFFVLAAGSAFAQETPTALAARKKLQQKITVDWKDITTKAIFEDIKSEMDKPPGFKIDTTTGMSLNTKLTYKAKDKTIEEVLNDLAEKFEFGWFVKSDGKDRYDGWIIIRKHKNKERGYEDGKEPKKKAGLDDADELMKRLAAIQRGQQEVADILLSEVNGIMTEMCPVIEEALRSCIVTRRRMTDPRLEWEMIKAKPTSSVVCNEPRPNE